MTLREKIQEETVYINAYSFKLTKESVEKFENISDDYAIKFAEWCIKWKIEFQDDTRLGIIYSKGGTHTKYRIKELLKIYKKEKGL
jgi:hypothetical protein